MISVETTSVRAHQHSAGARKGGCPDRMEDLAIEGTCLERSRGGLTTKIRLTVDAAGLPLADENRDFDVDGQRIGSGECSPTRHTPTRALGRRCDSGGSRPPSQRAD